MKHNHYHKNVKHMETIDVYRVLQLFGVTDPCLQHASKKVLCAGLRGLKSTEKDIQEAIDSLTRWQEMLAEDAKIGVEPASEPHQMKSKVFGYPVVEFGVDVDYDGKRVDRVASSHGDGEHYAVTEPMRCSDCTAEHCACVSK